MTKMITHVFTFGHTHVCTLQTPFILADHWVEVTLPKDYHMSHREVFVEMFTMPLCPSPDQFSFEYLEKDFDASYFPGGPLAQIILNK